MICSLKYRVSIICACAVLIVCAKNSAVAQNDTLVTVWNKKIICTVTEVNDTLINYVPENDSVSEKRTKITIKEIRLANGSQLKFKKTYLNAIKILPLSPYYCNIGLSYERFISKRLGIEFHLGYIDNGLNINSNLNNEFFTGFTALSEYKQAHTKQGAFVKAGLKIYLRNFTNGPIGSGWYIKPELAFSQFTVRDVTIAYSYYWYSYSNLFSDITSRAFGGLCNFGYQKILAGRLLCDFSAGIGYGEHKETFSNLDVPKNTIESISFQTNINYNAFYFVRPGLVYSLGFKLGYLF